MPAECWAEVSHQVIGSSTEKGETQDYNCKNKVQTKIVAFLQFIIKDFIQPTYHFVSCMQTKFCFISEHTK